MEITLRSIWSAIWKRLIAPALNACVESAIDARHDEGLLWLLGQNADYWVRLDDIGVRLIGLRPCHTTEREESATPSWQQRGFGQSPQLLRIGWRNLRQIGTRSARPTIKGRSLRLHTTVKKGGWVMRSGI
jgi:hypothetical protein